MPNVQVQFKRGDTNTLNNTPITNGMIYFDTQEGHIYMDNDSTRLEYANNMSHFMDKTVIDNLVDKNDTQNLVSYAQISNIIGNTNIGNVSILSAINSLYNTKALFTALWSDNAHQPFDTKTVVIDNIYPYYIIGFGSYILEYDEDDPFDEGTLVWKQDDTEIPYDDNSLSLNPLSSYYKIAVQNGVIYTNKFAFDTNNVVKNARRIQITSDISHNTTTFVFDRYGTYFNGVCVTSDENDKDIPIFIMGIKA